jgi:1-acyl-sn-glycerol-3-phosphate acyltransferase
VKFPDDASTLWKSLHFLVTVVKPLFCRLQVEGTEHVPQRGGCIVACNHTLGPDFMMLGYAMPRQIYFMAKTEIFAWNPLLTKILNAAGTFPVNRGKGDVAAIHTAVEIVQTGHILGMFPEGTRSRTGQLMRGKTGVARIAMTAQSPVVPAVVINAQRVLKDLLRPQRRPEVIVRFGPPQQLHGNADDPVEIRHNTDQIMRSMAALLPTALRGEYGAVESKS